jgi:hypothetical protein
MRYIAQGQPSFREHQNPCKTHTHASIPFPIHKPLPVGFLVAGTGTWTAKLLGLTSSVVGNEKGTVVGHESLLELVLAVLVDVFLVVGDLEARQVSCPIVIASGP